MDPMCGQNLFYRSFEKYASKNIEIKIQSLNCISMVMVCGCCLTIMVELFRKKIIGMKQ